MKNVKCSAMLNGVIFYEPTDEKNAKIPIPTTRKINIATAIIK